MTPPRLLRNNPDNKVHGATMGPTWVLSGPDGPHVGPMNLAMRNDLARYDKMSYASTKH